MNLTDVKPLQPLSGGMVLIVGGKASNFDEELRTHPRIIMWGSQNEHWIGKEIPQNVRAVFVTRFIGHVAFGRILADARKKRLTIFNPEGTGMIVKQVRELLGLAKPTTVEIKPPMTPTTQSEPKTGFKKKLHALVPFIDYDKNNVENSKILMTKAIEMGITSTPASLANFVGVERRKRGGAVRKTPVTRAVKSLDKQADVSVVMLDNMVKELQDMRDYLIAVTEENKSLKMRIEKFKKVLDND